jgi:dTMP kinase
VDKPVSPASPSSKTSKKGIFITFEGIEGSGKTTQLDLLYQTLKTKKIPVVKTFEPGGSSHGEKIRDLVIGFSQKKISKLTELFLFLADRTQHVQEIILPTLSKNQIVLCDRFSDSTLTYQGYGRGIDLDLIAKTNLAASFNLVPDLTFFLDLPVLEGLRRVRKRGKLNRMDKETVFFYEKVRKGYLKLAEGEKRIKVLDALQDKKKLQQEIFQQTSKLLSKRFNCSLERLT